MNFNNLNDFFDDVQDVYDSSDMFDHAEFANEMHYEAARALAKCVNTVGYINLSWIESAF